MTNYEKYFGSPEQVVEFLDKVCSVIDSLDACDLCPVWSIYPGCYGTTDCFARFLKDKAEEVV